MENGSPTHWQRPPRVAEVVAERLRSRIISGELRDGDRLPKEEDLRDEFPVAKPSIREAMRILETEGLLTVVRGNQGGAIVHTPSATNAAYTLGLVLSTQGVMGDDVADALRQLEPLCGELCALRPDRHETVVPILQALQDEAREAAAHLDRPEMRARLTEVTRQFHEQIVAGCGNRTLILVVGALESLWTSHVRALASSESRYKHESQLLGLDEHQEILDLIAQGNQAELRQRMAAHLERAQQLRSATGRGLIGLSSLRPTDR